MNRQEVTKDEGISGTKCLVRQLSAEVCQNGRFIPLPVLVFQDLKNEIWTSFLILAGTNPILHYLNCIIEYE